jgi:hypothetical protein
MTTHQHDPARHAGHTAPAGNAVGMSLIALINVSTCLRVITGQRDGELSARPVRITRIVLWKERHELSA